MTEREKIVDIIQKSVGGCSEYWAGLIADALLENGVIVPPCKVGNTVYQYKQVYSKCSLGEYPNDYDCQGCVMRCDSKKQEKLFEGVVRKIEIFDNTIKVVADWGKDRWDTSSYEVGKTVFLSREEAEEALKAREK